MTPLQLIAALLSILVLMIHWAFVLFVALGGVVALAWPRPRVKWLHAGCAIWGASSLLVNMPCPLTWTENSLRHVAGWPPYPSGCLDYYIPRSLALLHLPQIGLHTLVAIALAINMVCYTTLWLRRESHRARRASA